MHFEPSRDYHRRRATVELDLEHVAAIADQHVGHGRGSDQLADLARVRVVLTEPLEELGPLGIWQRELGVRLARGGEILVDTLHQRALVVVERLAPRDIEPHREQRAR